MADKSFDVVVIGGGNKALITSMYLSKYGGLSVGIFEDRHELGGCWSCEEPAPGFIANVCSTAHMANYHLPVYEDFPEWDEYGARYAHTKVSTGVSYIEDNTCALVYTSFDDVDPNQEKTAKEMSRFSEKDGETWLYFWERCQKYWRPAIDEWMFTPAKPLGVPDALDRLLQNKEAGIDPLWMFQSPLQTYKDIFDSVELKHAFARANQSWGYQSDLAGAGLGAALFLFYAWPRHCCVIGGSHQLSHSSQRVTLENG